MSRVKKPPVAPVKPPPVDDPGDKAWEIIRGFGYTTTGQTYEVVEALEKAGLLREPKPISED